MNAQQLMECTGCDVSHASLWLEPIIDAMGEFAINTPVRQAAFLAQVGHETGGLRWVVERWGPTPAQARYEGRKDLGNVHPGDGYKFRGRGLIQITGRDNYEAAAKALGYDVVDDPDALAEPDFAAASAAWWWAEHGLNKLADEGAFIAITRRINGGTNGLEDRQALWAKAKKALGVPCSLTA